MNQNITVVISILRLIQLIVVAILIVLTYNLFNGQSIYNSDLITNKIVTNEIPFISKLYFSLYLVIMALGFFFLLEFVIQIFKKFKLDNFFDDFIVNRLKLASYISFFIPLMLLLGILFIQVNTFKKLLINLSGFTLWLILLGLILNVLSFVIARAKKLHQENQLTI